MSTNQSTPTEEQAIYKRMLTVTWVSAISALLAAAIAAFGIFSFWQTNRLLLERFQDEQVHVIDNKPSEILEGLDLAQSGAVAASTDLAASSPPLLVLNQGSTATANYTLLQVDPATGSLVEQLSPRLFALVDGQLVPVELPLEMQAENAEVVTVRLLSPQADRSGAKELSLVSASLPSAPETSILPTQDADVHETSVDEEQGQFFGVSFETISGTRKVTIITWYNY